MSNSAPPRDATSLKEVVSSTPLDESLDFLTVPLRFVGFWAAVALPFLYVPLLVGGLQGDQVTVFAGLLALNAFALVVGHGYNPRQ